MHQLSDPTIEGHRGGGESIQEAFVNAIVDLSTARDIDEIVAILRDAARRVSDADGVCIVLRDGDQCHYVDEDAIGPLWKGRRFPISGCLSGWCMLNRRPAVIPDTERDTRIPQDLYRPTFVRSLVMVPIGTADPIGAIGVYWAKMRDPSPETVLLLESLARSAVVPLSRAASYRSLLTRVDELAALYRFTDSLFRARSAAEAYDAALDAILGTLGCNRASILLCDDTGFMRFVAWRGLSEEYRAAVEGHSPWQPGAPHPLPVLVGDIEDADEPESLKRTVRAEGIRALTFIPLMAGGTLIGKFMTYHDTPQSFTDADANLALSISRQLGFFLERNRAETQRTLLMNELNHRVKNTLSTVQSLAMQTFRDIAGNAGVCEVFDARLAALSRAHDVLTSRSWAGADLREIVVRALEPFGLDADRVTTDGPAVALTPRRALALSMTLHELATNAAKYGALSNRSGTIRVLWRTAGGDGTRVLHLEWRESGGPPVQPPIRRGFGTRLIERSLSTELGGNARLDYLPDGVVCTIRSPLTSDIVRPEFQ